MAFIVQGCFGNRVLKKKVYWLVWLSGLSVGLQIKGLLVRFPVSCLPQSSPSSIASHLPRYLHGQGGHLSVQPLLGEEDPGGSQDKCQQQQADTAKTTPVDVNSLELVPLGAENGSEIKKVNQAHLPSRKPVLFSKGGSEDMTTSSAVSPSFEKVSPACGSREGWQKQACLCPQYRAPVSGQGGSAKAASLGPRPPPHRPTGSARAEAPHHRSQPSLRAAPGNLSPSPGTLLEPLSVSLQSARPARHPRAVGAAAHSGWPPLLPGPRASCSYKLSKLKMLLRVGDKRESWVSP